MSHSPSRLRRTALAGCAVLALAAPSAAFAQARTPGDPYEHLNRRIFAFNQVLYRRVFRPAALEWKRVVPGPVRAGLRNALSNLGEPVVMFNDVLQGRAKDASVSLGRFLGNSTVGVAGLFDVAKRGGLPHHDNDFGLTLGRHGAKPGPYIYLPVLGPTTLRDGIGKAGDVVLNPFTYINYGSRTAVGIGTGISGGLNTFADADDDLQSLKRIATDEYATLRSFYLQNRQAQVDGRDVSVQSLPDFDDPSAPKPAPVAAGSVSPSGAPPIPTTTAAPQGDAAALPHPASATPPPGPGPN